MRLVRTLRGRLVVIAMVWCGLFLFATGFSLQTMMRNYWQEAEADGLRLQLYDLLSRLEIQPDGIDRFNLWVKRAAEQGQSEIQIMRFPSQYCTDHGRAINNFEEGWPDTLTGMARRIYEAYDTHLKAQGYKMRAQILNYPDGGLGEVGLYIGW